MRSVLPWSFSSYSAYQTCPRQFYEVKIAKNWIEEQSEAVLWGNTVHKAFEDNIKVGTPLPPTVQRFEKVLDSYKRLPGEAHAEIELAFTKDLTPTGFWDEDAYCRGKGDLVKVNGNKSANIDWKTGKESDARIQGDIIKLCMASKYPYFEQYEVIFVYLFKGGATRTIYRPKEQRLVQLYEDIADLEEAEKSMHFPPTPNGLCKKWCDVLSCPHNGRNK